MIHWTGRIVERRELRGLLRFVVVTLAMVGASCEQVESQQSVQTPAQKASEYGKLSFDNLTVPRNEIHAGGPPKDGIPAITDPDIVTAQSASFLTAQSRVIGTTIGKDSRAWPIAILNYHEIINDTLGEIPIAVTYCPLCDSAAIFDRRTEDGVREFGVSGLLYNSNVLMYERAAGEQSLFSQVQGQGVSGPGAKQPLKTLPVELTTWQDWHARHPDTTVASLQTGHHRNYARNPYGDYFSTPNLMFPVQNKSDRFPPKQRVLGLWSGDNFLAMPLSLTKTRIGEFDVTVGGKTARLAANDTSGTIRVVKADDGIQWMYSLWFAWYAFHPETAVIDD